MQALTPDTLARALGVEALDLSQDPVGHVYARVDPDGEHAEVRYVALDPHPPRVFWPPDGSRGRLLPLRARDAAREAADAALVLPVRVTRDGAFVALPTQGTRGSTHIYVPPEPMSRAVSAGEATLEGLMAWSRRQVSAFDSWKRGEVYGLVREVLGLSEDGGTETREVDARWLRLCLDDAYEALEEESSVEPVPAPAP